MPNFKMARWPGFAEKGTRQRQLALMENNTLSLADRDMRIDSWAQLCDVAFSLARLPEIYVTDIIGQWWWEDALNDPSVTAMVPSSALIRDWSMIQCLQVRRGRKRVWIICAKTWHVQTASPDFLAALQTLFDLVGVGVRPTPGSLGQALMRQHWQQENRRWIARPSNAARRDILRHSLGGRVDYLTTPQKRFETVYETDLSGAYGSVCDRLPAGSQCTLHAEPGAGDVVSYFMDCTVRIPAGEPLLPFGIFGERTPEGTNAYPVQPGEYHVWLWKEEVDLCRRNGWIVIPTAGWGWTNWSDGLSRWAQRMYQLRLLAEDAIGSAGSQWMKLSMVAALGRFGMPLWSWKLLPEEHPDIQHGDLCLLHQKRETGWMLHLVTDWQANHLSHWYSYILMRARLVLRSRMLWEHERGNTVLMSNYDALYCLLPADPLHLAKGLGGWKQTLLTRVRFPFPRGVISREKTTLPGHKGTRVALAFG